MHTARERDRAGGEGREGRAGRGNMLHALLHMAIVMIYVAKIFQARFRRAICLFFAACTFVFVAKCSVLEVRRGRAREAEDS